MNYYIIAGEASGDLHASNLMKHIIQEDPDATFRFYGGNLMQKQGGVLVKHYREMAFMGFIDVLANIKTISKNLQVAKKEIINYKPDVLILIDYPGFNLKLAKYAHTAGIMVFYYISPKVWVWKEHRVKQLKEYVDRLYVIFPFEVEYFKQFNLEVDYVGNPLLDSVEEFVESKPNDGFFKRNHKIGEKPVIAILPGSRKKEIQRLLPLMLQVSNNYSKDYEFVIAATSSIDRDIYSNIIQDYKVKLVFDNTYSLLNISYAAIVASGTATLETALFNVPQLVCYKIEWPTFIIGKPFFKLKYFSLVNLIMNKEVVKEILQVGMVKKMKVEMDKILNNLEYYAKIKDEYKQLRQIMGTSGCSEKLANLMVTRLKECSKNKKALI